MIRKRFSDHFPGCAVPCAWPKYEPLNCRCLACIDQFAGARHESSPRITADCSARFSYSNAAPRPWRRGSRALRRDPSPAAPAPGVLRKPNRRTRNASLRTEHSGRLFRAVETLISAELSMLCDRLGGSANRWCSRFEKPSQARLLDSHVTAKRDRQCQCARDLSVHQLANPGGCPAR